MKLLEYIAVNRYFRHRLNKIKTGDCYVSYPSIMTQLHLREKGIETISGFTLFGMFRKKLKYLKWVRQSLGVCYEHASSILLGLKPTDKCVIGRQDYHRNEKFYHAWNEFEFSGKWYVYDCAADNIYEKDFYLNYVEPNEIIATYTLNDVLNEYICYKNEQKNIIEIPNNLYLTPNKYPGYEKPYPYVGSRNECYSGAKIKLNKKSQVKSAHVEPAEIG